MAVKLLHTADWQIGMRAAQLGAAAARARAARLETARRIAELAGEESVDVVVLAGDTFENHSVALSDVEAVAGILASCPCPVLVLPGNHDPVTAGGVWDLPAWSGADNVRVARLPAPAELESCVLFPCPVSSRWGAGDPTGWIPTGQYRDRIRIGVAHGAVAGLPGEPQSLTVPADAPELRGLDYLALGDWHSARLYSGADGAVRMAYSGTPEPTSFAEDASGHVLIVEIEAPGAVPRIRQQRVARLKWIREKLEVLEPGALARFRERLAACAGDETVAEVLLTGTLYPEEQAELEALRQLSGKFLSLRISENLGQVLRLEDLPMGPLRDAAQRLERMADGGEQAEEARVALRTLLTLARGAGA